LVFFRGLVWEFSAETLAILVVTIAVGLIGVSTQLYRTYWAIAVLSLYPASLLFVYVLENYAHLQ
jgi:hypothetical protein